MAQPPRTDPYAVNDLPTVLHRIWQHLRHAVDSAKTGFHLPTLATVDADGQPAARIVVLRRVDVSDRRIACHTDRRSPKVRELQGGTRSTWVFYDADKRVQLRVAGVTTVHSDDALTDAQWAASNLSSRRCYLAPHPPGTEADGPSPNLPDSVRDRVPEADETLSGRANFAVLTCTVDRIDFLYLHHAGHRRAEFTWTAESSDPAMRWVEV